MKSLVVEDEFTSRAQLQYFLMEYGECDVATNADEALEAFRASRQNDAPYDLICLDIRLPGKDGKEILSEIRGIEDADRLPTQKRARIFMTTALGDYSNISTSFRNLCDEYLKKPILKDKLKELLNRYDLID
jgi:two-component system, chemotaxis family, chemotaxis protein CheY